jgi:hypothetical protein
MRPAGLRKHFTEEYVGTVGIVEGDSVGVAGGRRGGVDTVQGVLSLRI